MAPSLETLPGEVFLQIMSYLEPLDIVRLQLVSTQLLRTGRDDGFWRLRCFDDSTYLETLLRRRMLFGPRGFGGIAEPRRASSSSPGDGDSGAAAVGVDEPEDCGRDKLRIMANWDPVFPGEKVSWYDEYIQRNAPIAMNWFQSPRHNDQGRFSRAAVEARGVALYRPDGTSGALLAVSPLDDGSVCLWDVNGTRGLRGAIISQSPPGILFTGLQSDQPRVAARRKAQFGVTECVSVDSQRHLAFFSVHNRLVEVDLQRLAVTGEEQFPWSITALSTSQPTVPLSVGMNLGVHMHDTRARAGYRTETCASSVSDSACQSPCVPAPHPEPGPISILHLQRPGSEEDISDDIYTAGRLPIILHYDRRKLSSIKDTIYSGASLCSMTSLPYSFSAMDSDLRREGALSLSQVERSKAVVGGRTIVACGEYKSKGSLELYGIGMTPASAAAREAEGIQYRENSTLKNRQTSSFSKILAVATHGTRLVFADGAGQIKWFERDGVTEVRSCKINGGEGRETAPSLFGSAQDSGDIARKLLPTRPTSTSSGLAGGAEDNGLLFWTGEKLGLVSFSSEPGFEADDFDDMAKTAQELAAEEQERAYSAKMRQLLEKQANDVRFVRNLGLGSARRGR